MHWYTPAQSQQARMFRLLTHHKIDTVQDIGANEGGYGQFFAKRRARWDYSLSFEPLKQAHQRLVALASRDQRWEVAPRMALGDKDGETKINVAGNSTSSSILPMHNLHVSAAPDSRYVGSELVSLQKLDKVHHPTIDQAESIFLKIDAQGYEMPILRGAKSLLPRVRGVQLELSIEPLYVGQTLYLDTIKFLQLHGFTLWNVIPGFSDNVTGRMLQMDGTFFRTGGGTDQETRRLGPRDQQAEI